MNLDKAKEIIKEFEGLYLKAYKCPGGKNTIGYGHTFAIKDDDTCTKEQAEKWLEDDIKYASNSVERFVQVKLEENQFNALVSFVFNVGSKNFEKSTLLKILNRGWYEQVPAQLMRWNKVNGEVLGGLSRRRAKEAALFNKRS